MIWKAQRSQSRSWAESDKLTEKVNHFTREVFQNRAFRVFGPKRADFAQRVYDGASERARGENDQALLRHQLYHARGNLMQNWIRSIRYKFSSEFRYQEEVEAYRVQIEEMRKSKTVLVQQIVRLNNRILDSYSLPERLSINAYPDLIREEELDGTLAFSAAD